MIDTRPFLVVPRSQNVAHMLDRPTVEAIRSSERARRNGVVVIMPREIQPSALMAACYLWPSVLRDAGVPRIAIVLGVATYAVAEPLLQGCARSMAGQGVSVAYFHEGHVESDQIRAWFERRKSQRRVTSQVMVALVDRYVERGDMRGAVHAAKLAERLAA